jgi:hypothetical protein
VHRSDTAVNKAVIPAHAGIQFVGLIDLEKQSDEQAGFPLSRE